MRAVLLAMVLISLGVAPATAPSAQGTVYDTKGSPIAGAKVMLYARRSTWGLDNEVVETTKSDEDGQFRFTKPLTFKVPNGTDYTDYYFIVATHPDYAVGWRRILGIDRQDDHDIVLTEPTKQSFLVKDRDDVPLAGATVWLYQAGDSEDPQPSLRASMLLPTNIGIAAVKTDALGRATLTNLPKTYVSFLTSLDGFGDEYKSIRRVSDKEIEQHLTRAGIVRGHVVDEDDQPVKGAVVRFRTDWMWHIYPVRTDDAGNFSISLIARGGSWTENGGNGTYKVTIQHPDFCCAEQTVSVDPGQVVEDLKIPALHGGLLRLTAIDPETNAPIAGARVGAFASHNVELDGYTDENGVIEFRALPGPLTASFRGPPGGWYMLGDGRSQNLTLGNGELDVSVYAPSALKRVVDMRGKVILPDGSPAAAAKVAFFCSEKKVRTQGLYGYAAETAADKHGLFALVGYPGGTHMTVYCETPNRKFAAAAEFDISETGGDLGEPLKLKPTQSVEYDLAAIAGFDVSNRKVSVCPVVGPDQFWRIGRTIPTDAVGKMKIDGVLPGMTYHLQDKKVQDALSKQQSTKGLFDQDVEFIPE